jgi:hypothetical protein
MINIAKTDKEMDKMFKKLDEDFIRKMKALTLHLTPDEALELIHEVVDIPDGFYLGVNNEDILEVTLFECDNNVHNKMGKAIEGFYLESYRPSELISFGIELLKYINELEYKSKIKF